MHLCSSLTFSLSQPQAKQSEGFGYDTCTIVYIELSSQLRIDSAPIHSIPFHSFTITTIVIMDPSPLPLKSGGVATAVAASSAAGNAESKMATTAEPTTTVVPKADPAAAAALAAALAAAAKEKQQQQQQQPAKKPVKVDEHGNEVEDEKVISEEDREKISDEDADEVAYTPYQPAKLRYGRPHPDPVVENSSLGAVQPPDVTCTYYLLLRLVCLFFASKV